MLCVSTAKAYFPDRQSCSTLCRQPSGCARSVEVVAVYPSLGSYSIVGLLRWASLPFKKPFTYMDKMRPFGGGFINNSLLNLRFAQKSYSFFVQYNESYINPSTYPHWEREKTNPNKETFLFLQLCTNSSACFCTIFRFKKSPLLLPTGKRILLPHFEKELIPSHLYLMGEVIFEVRLQIFVALHKSYNLFLYSIKLKKVLHLYCEKSSNN